MNFKTLSAAALISCALAPNMASASAIQWSSGTGANSHYYMTTDSKTTWTDANSLAQSLGGYLVSITSAAEQAFLENSFLKSNPLNAFWTGLNDAAKEGTFVWTSGEAFTYNHFRVNEPNDSHAGTGKDFGQDYAVLNWDYLNGNGYFGYWNDTANVGCQGNYCTAPQLLGAIIEFDHDPSVSVPEPAPLAFAAIGLMGIAALRRRKEAL